MQYTGHISINPFRMSYVLIFVFKLWKSVSAVLKGLSILNSSLLGNSLAFYVNMKPLSLVSVLRKTNSQPIKKLINHVRITQSPGLTPAAGRKPVVGRRATAEGTCLRTPPRVTFTGSGE